MWLVMMDHRDVDVFLTKMLDIHTAFLIEHNVLDHFVRYITPGKKTHNHHQENGLNLGISTFAPPMEDTLGSAPLCW